MRVLLGLLLLPALMCGCTAATVASAGAIIGAAGSSISTSSEVFQMGKLDAVDMTEFERQIEGVRCAARDLSLTMEKEEHNAPGQWRCTIADVRKTRFRVYVDRRSETLCRTRVDVGFFGSEPTARLFLTRVRLNVGGPATQPVLVEPK